MNRTRKQLYQTVVIACLILAVGNLSAAEVKTEQHAAYSRVNFTFGSPARLTVTSSGNQLVLQFDKPVQESAAAIKAKLAGYATGASLSVDGKQVTLTMNKPYRTRQFVSGNGIGIDIIGKAEPVTAPAVIEPPVVKKEPTPPPAKKIEVAKKEVPKPAAAKPVEKKPEPKKQATAIVTVVEQKSITPPVMQKAIPEKPVEAPKAIVTTPTEDPIMTTKKPEAAPAPVAEAKAPPVAATPAPSEYTTKAPTEPEQAPAAEEAHPAPALAAHEEPAHTKAPAKPTESTPAATSAEEAKSFIVSVRPSEGGTLIHFPWRARTSAAVFERGRDIWVVFGRPVDANVALLRTVMPKPVADVTQYNYPGNTVLRISTDGSLHGTASQQKGGYGWDVTLGGAPATPALDIPVAADTVEGPKRLVLGAFDVSDTVRFYDPRIGDLLLVVPSYENGRGVAREKNFPELTLLSSAQGIGIISTRPDVTVDHSRVGVTVRAKDGLAVSENTVTITPDSPAAAGSNAIPSGVMMPYNKWYVPPEQFKDTLAARLQAAASASPDARPDSLMALVSMHMGSGLAAEAKGYLQLIQRQYPDYYKARRLALVEAAADVMQDHIDDAAAEIAAPELNDLPEAELWREAIGLYVPPVNTVQQELQKIEGTNTPPGTVISKSDDDHEDSKDGAKTAAAATSSPTPAKPAFRFLKWNKPYIHFYPPRIRQRLAVMAADAYNADGLEEKALAAFDSLNRDGILDPIKMYAEFTLAAAAAKKGDVKQALALYDQLGEQTDDLYIQARARYAGAMLRYRKAMADAQTTTDALERMRMGWRGDKLERAVLVDLAEIYRSTKAYDDTLRSMKALLDAFPYDPETLKISGDMTTLFEDLYMNGLADEMPPLKSLSLFYEFRDLTPIGDRGDLIIQKLADRLAAFDLLDRATQLLEHQIKFRVVGENRSRVGARLALLYLLNHKPQEALDVLQITNFGTNAPELQQQRQQLMAEALTSIGKHEEALGMLYNDASREGALLRLDILWSMQDWPNVVNRAEDILSNRPSLTATLTPTETEVLLKLALGYSFQADYNQLRYLRDYYSALIPDSGYKQIFDFVTNDTNPLDPADLAMVTQQISHTEGFLTDFKAKIAAGKLSEAVK